MLIQVTAAIIRREGQYLICQRAHDDALPLLWEFPGGKLEDGETLEECIVRRSIPSTGIPAIVNRSPMTSGVSSNCT